MRLVKTVQTLTLSTVFVLVLSACHQKENHATNTTTQTGSVMQEEGVDGTGSGVGSAAGTGSTDTANNHTTQQSVNNAMPNSSNVSSEANHPNAQPTETTSNNGNTSTGDGDHNGTDSGTDDGNSTAGGSGTDDNATDGGTNSNAATLQSLNLKIATTTLNRDHSTTITPKATYDDNTTKTPTNIEWIINPKDAVSIEGNTLIAKQDTNVTIQAKVGNILSNKVHLNIYWEVDGHRLPPEPAPKINNATLLGVDVNNNGVRDDVERWIYKTYYHPIERGIFMQSARAYQKVIVDPKRAHETVKYTDDALSCQLYWIYVCDPKPFDKYEFFTHRKEFKKVQFNTIKRHMAYQRFNAEFNGETFDSPKASKDKCEFDENGILKAEQ